MICCLYYFIVKVPLIVSNPDIDSNILTSDLTSSTVLVVVIIQVISLYLLAIEIRQMIFFKLNYLYEAYNYGQLMTLLLNSVMVL
jgi:hypothetical protein